MNIGYRYIFVFLLTVIFTYTQGQGVRSRVIFEENFDVDRGEWITGDRGKTIAFISNGLFHLKSKKRDYGYSRRIEGGYLRNYQNFEIEIKFRQVGENSHRGYALEWGGNSIDNIFYEFWLRNDGYYAISRYNANIDKDLDYVSYTASSAINIGEFNVLKVKKTGASLRYYINETLVFEAPFEKLYGGEIGFKSPPPPVSLEVDYLKITLFGEPPQAVFAKEYIPSVYAVIVGIADYKNDSEGFSDLRFTVSDAIAMAKFYMSENGGVVPEENITLLLDEQATYKNIIKQTQLLFSKARKEDMIIFYFAGHGTTDESSLNPLLHLIPYDFDGKSLNSAIVYTDIEGIFNSSAASKKLWLLDACHSGGTLEALSGSIKDRLRSLVDKEIAIITSSNVSETSLEVPGNIKRGLFSYNLTKGLIQEADSCDTNKDNVVDILELFNYVKTETSTSAKIYDHIQNPQIGGKFNVQLPIANVIRSSN